MDWTWNPFSFKGRINRAKLWLALLVIICWMIFLVRAHRHRRAASSAAPNRSTSRSATFYLYFDPAAYCSLSRTDLFPAFRQADRNATFRS